MTSPFIWKEELSFGGLGEHVSNRMLRGAMVLNSGDNLNEVLNLSCTRSTEEKLHGFHRVKKSIYQDPPVLASRYLRRLDREKKAHDDAAEYEKAPRLYSYIFRQLPKVVLDSTCVDSADRLRLHN